MQRHDSQCASVKNELVNQVNFLVLPRVTSYWAKGAVVISGVLQDLTNTRKRVFWKRKDQFLGHASWFWSQHKVPQEAVILSLAVLPFCKQIKRTEKGLLLPLLPTVILPFSASSPFFPFICNLTNNRHAECWPSDFSAASPYKTFQIKYLGNCSKADIGQNDLQKWCSLLWKTPWIGNGFKKASLGTRSVNSECFVWSVCQKTQDWLLQEAIMLFVMLLRAFLLILMVGLVFQRGLACALQELFSFHSENATNSAVCCSTNLHPISYKCVNEHLFHIMFSFSTLGLGWGSSAEAEEPCVLSQPTPTAQAVVVGGSLPPAELDLHCAAGTGCTLGNEGGSSLWLQWRLRFPHFASLVPAGIAQVSYTTHD